jgi:hypothetical protein
MKVRSLKKWYRSNLNSCSLCSKKRIPERRASTCSRKYLKSRSNTFTSIHPPAIWLPSLDDYWWNKPPYLRLPLQNLDWQALCEDNPGLKFELEEVAAAQGKKTVDAYMVQQSRGFVWLTDQLLSSSPTQFEKIGLRIHVSYRAGIVFGLSACHLAILLLPTWRVNLSSTANTETWRKNLEFSFVFSAIITVLAAIDIVARHISREFPKLRKLYSATEDATPTNDREGGAVRYAIDIIDRVLLSQNSASMLACIYTAAVGIAATTISQASDGIYAVGPGDVPKYDITIFGGK